MLSRAKLNIKWLLWWTDRVRDEENVQSNEYSRAMRTWCLCQERKCVCTKNKPIREQSEVKFLLWKRENIDLLRTRSTNDISRDVINWIVDIFNGKVMDWSKYLFIYVKNIFVQFVAQWLATNHAQLKFRVTKVKNENYVHSFFLKSQNFKIIKSLMHVLKLFYWLFCTKSHSSSQQKLFLVTE